MPRVINLDEHSCGGFGAWKGMVRPPSVARLRMLTTLLQEYARNAQEDDGRGKLKQDIDNLHSSYRIWNDICGYPCQPFPRHSVSCLDCPQATHLTVTSIAIGGPETVKRMISCLVGWTTVQILVRP